MQEGRSNFRLSGKKKGGRSHAGRYSFRTEAGRTCSSVKVRVSPVLALKQEMVTLRLTMEKNGLLEMILRTSGRDVATQENWRVVPSLERVTI